MSELNMNVGDLANVAGSVSEQVMDQFLSGASKDAIATVARVNKIAGYTLLGATIVGASAAAITLLTRKR